MYTVFTASESLGLDVVVQLHNMGFVDKSSGGANGANPHATVSVPSEVHTQGPHFGCNLESDTYASAADQLRGYNAFFGDLVTTACNSK